SRFREAVREIPVASRRSFRDFNNLSNGTCVALPAWRRGGREMKKTILASVAGLVLFGGAAMAQVEQPQQLSGQGTALITKDSTNAAGTNQATRSGGFLVGYSYQFNNWAGVEGNYGWTRNTQNYLGSFGGSSVRSDMHEVTGSFVFHIPVPVSG